MASSDREENKDVQETKDSPAFEDRKGIKVRTENLAPKVFQVRWVNLVCLDPLDPSV